MNHDREKLFESYLDGDLAGAQASELAALLENEPDARVDLLRFVLLETQLTEPLLARDEDQRAEEFQESLGFTAVVDRGRSESAPSRPAAIRRRRQSWLAIASVAAALLIAIGMWSALSKPGQTSHQVLTGRVLIDNGQSENPSDLPAGSAIQVAGNEPAEIQLSDGSHVEFEPASRAVLHGESGGVRQVVELVEGSGTFQVLKGEKQFQVQTSIGDVTVLGTEFSVELLSSEPEIGQSEMKKALLMAVAVYSGSVLVDFDGKSHTLAAGDSKVFGEKAEQNGVDNSALLAQMAEFFGLTEDQQKAFPAAEAAYTSAYRNLNYSQRKQALRDAHKDGALDARAYWDASRELRYERKQVLVGTGTLDQILTDEQKADWGAFQQYRNIVPTLNRKGVELSKEQQAATRKKCRALADKLDGMEPSRAYFAKWSVFRELKDHVEGKVLTKEQRAKLANAK